MHVQYDTKQAASELEITIYYDADSVKKMMEVNNIVKEKSLLV